MTFYRKLVMTESEARRHGFPVPRPGMAVKDLQGRWWTVTGGTDGLGELGFLWTALIPLGTSLISGIFGGNAAKKEAEAIKAQAAAMIEVERLRLQQAQASAIPWNLVILGGAAVLGLMVISGK